MGKKRRHKDRDMSDRLLRRIEKLEGKLRKRRRRSYSSSSRSSISRSRSQSPERNHNYHNEYYAKEAMEPIAHEEIGDDPATPVEQLYERTASDESTQGTPSATPPADPPAMQSLSANGNSDVDNTNNHLDDDILTILGDAPKPESPVGKDIHHDIATRLQDILLNGLKKESKEKITEEYHVPGNCSLFKAPMLNPEVKAAVSDLLQKKDSSLAARQGQIGIALTALTSAMEILTSDKSDTSQTILKHISNASRLLCDSHYIDTKMRRNFLISTLNNKLKDTLKESKRDAFLFGEVLPEKLKATKAITKTSQDLRPYRPKSVVTRSIVPSTTPHNLNWKHPQPTPSNSQRKPLASAQRRTAGPSTSHRGETTRKTLSSRVNKTNAHCRQIKKY